VTGAPPRGIPGAGRTPPPRTPRLAAPRGLWQSLPMIRRSWLLALALPVLGVGLAPSAEARRIGRTSYSNKRVGIRIFLPARWVQQVRSGYPGLLASFLHPRGARFLLSARVRKPTETPIQLARRNARALRKRGWTVKPPSVTRLGVLPAQLLQATDPKGTQQVVQIYAVRGKHAFVLTLSVPAPLRARFLTDLRYIQKTARFKR